MDTVGWGLELADGSSEAEAFLTGLCHSAPYTREELKTFGREEAAGAAETKHDEEETRVGEHSLV